MATIYANPGTVTPVSPGKVWTDPDNVKTSPSPAATPESAGDADYALAPSLSVATTEYSQTLKCQNYNFSAIPAGATIDAVYLQSWIMRNSGANVQDYEVYFLDATGAAVGSNLAQAVQYDPSPGGWKSWTADVSFSLATVQNSNFGATFKCYNTTGATNVSVRNYFLRIRVDYTPAATGKPTHYMHYQRMRRAC